MKCLHPVFRRVVLRCGVLSLLVVGGAAAALAAKPAEMTGGVAEVLFEEGKRHYDRGRYEDAAHEFQKVLLVEPAHRRAREYLALIDRLRRERTAAMDASLEALARTPPEPASELSPPSPAEAPSQPQSTTPSYDYEEPSPTPTVIAPSYPMPAEANDGAQSPTRTAAIEEALTAAAARSPRAEAAQPIEPPVLFEPEGLTEAAVVEAPLTPVARAPVSRVGQIGLFIDDVEVQLQRPIEVVDGEPLIPLRDLAAALYVTLIELGGGRVQLIFPNGAIKPITVSMPGEEPRLTEQEVRDFFNVETIFDPGRAALLVRTTQPSGFRTYVVEKSAEELQEEARQEALVKQIEEGPPPPEGAVEAARPSIDLTGTVSYGYRDPHGRPPDRTLIYGVTGQAYDFAVRGESSRKDRGGIFDHDYTYLNLSKPDLFIGLFDQSTNLYPLRGQSESVTGLKVRKAWDQGWATNVIGGTTETTVSGATRQVKYLGQLFQAGQELQPADWAKLNTSVLYVENEVDLPELLATSTLPRRNLVSFTDLTLTLPYDLGLSTSVARADYVPDDDNHARKGDWDIRINPFWETDRSSLQLTYELVGDRYASVDNPANYRDYEGWSLFGSHRLTDWWSVSGNVLLFGNNVDEEPHRITQDNEALSLTTNFRLPWEHTWTLSYSDFLSDPSGPEPGSSSRTRLYRTDYTLPFVWDTRLSLNYNQLRTNQPAASDSYSHALGASLFKGFEWGSSLYLSELLTKSAFEDAPDTWNATTTFNVNYQLRPTLSLYWNSTYTRNVTEQASGTDTLSGSTGLRWQLTPERALSAEYNVSSYDIDREHGRLPREWSVFVLLSQQFGFRSRPTFGSIAGRVVEDANGNGQFDPGEVGVAEATVQLDERGRKTMTTEGGFFSFSRVVPGRHTVTLDAASLPEAWTLRETAQSVTVGRMKRASVTFLIVEAGAITARVFIDGNGDGQFQETEEPLEGVAVVMQPGDQFRRSSDEGLVRFDHVMPGRYVVQVYEDDVPVGYTLTSERERAVDVGAGETVGEVPFAVELLQQ